MGASLEKGAALATEATSTTRPDNFTFDKYSLGLRLSVRSESEHKRRRAGSTSGRGEVELTWPRELNTETERRHFWATQAPVS